MNATTKGTDIRPTAKSYACCEYQSPVGVLTLAAGEDGLKGLWLEGQKYFGATLDGPMQVAANRHLEDARIWLDDYFSGKDPDVSRLSLAPIGSEFRQIIWRLLCEIPLGQLRTYGDLARDAATLLGRKSMSSQAVGGAVGHNPINIIVPCHRVVGANGSLTGYAGGIDRKLWLLEHEGANCSGLFVPKHSTAP